MKKFMKKKVSIFGKSVSVFAIVMVAMIGLVSAALVPYLSGLVIGTASVTSPILVQIADGNAPTDLNWEGTNNVPVVSEFDSDGSITMTPAFGGESGEFWLRLENRANTTLFDYENESEQDTSGWLVLEISAPNGITEVEGRIGDFDTALTIYDWNGPSGSLTKRMNGPVSVYEAVSVFKVDSTTWRIYSDVEFYNPYKESNKDGSYFYVYVDMDFALNAVGTYTINVAVFDNGQLENIESSNALDFQIN